MNRTFAANLTPARARLLLLMHRHAAFEIDDAVIAMAEEDRISDQRFVDAGMEDEMEREAVQFIHDTNFRAGIPVSTSDRLRATRIVRTALTLSGIDDFVMIDGSKRGQVSAPNEIVEYDYDTLIPLRKKLLVVNIDNLDSKDSMEIVGKMFPRILCMGSMLVQYSFAFGGQTSTTTRMGQLLYPAVEDAVSKSTWKRNERQTMLAMGVYPDFLGDPSKAPKVMANDLVMKRQSKY